MQVKFNKLAWALATVGLVTGLAGCGGGGGGSPSTGFDNDPVQISSKAVDVTLAFVDANDPTKLITAPVSYKLTGQAPGMLTTLPGSSGKGTVINTGAVRTTATGTESLLADFSQGGSFTVTPDSNWISYPPTVTQGGSVVIKLLKKESNDTSTYVTASTTGSSTGALTAEIPDNSGLGAAKITINPDPSLGTLSIAVVKFADAKAAQLDATLTQGTFSLGDNLGMARFVVTDSTGKVIKNFPNGLTLQIQLADQDTPVGPYSGGIRSYDEGTGKWTSEAISGTVKTVNSVKVVEFTTNHLSIWSLGDTSPGYCSASSLTLTGRPVGNSDDITFRMVDSATGGSNFDKTRTGVTDNLLSLFFVPSLSMNVTATKTGTNTVVGQLNNVSFCNNTVAQPQSMPLNGLIAATPATLRVNVIEVCEEDVNISRPGPTNVQFTPTGSSLASGGWTGDDASIDITKVFNPFNLEVDLTLGTTGSLKIYNRFTNQWDTVPNAGATFTVDGIDDGDNNSDVETVNWRIATTCNVPTGSTGAF